MQIEGSQTSPNLPFLSALMSITWFIVADLRSVLTSFSRACCVVSQPCLDLNSVWQIKLYCRCLLVPFYTCAFRSDQQGTCELILCQSEQSRADDRSVFTQFMHQGPLEKLTGEPYQLAHVKGPLATVHWLLCAVCSLVEWWIDRQCIIDNAHKRASVQYYST